MSRPSTHRLIAVAPLLLRAGATSSALPGRIDGTAYSGATVPGQSLVIDLSTTGFAAPMPLLYEHRRDAVVGVIEGGGKVGGRLEVSGRLFSDIPGGQAERIAQLAKRGVPLQLSVGLFYYSELFVAAGQQVTVNDRTVSGPVTVLSGGTVREVSVVALGADADSSARFFSDGVRPMRGAAELYELRRRQAEASR